MRILLAILLFATACTTGATAPAMRDGDIIFHASRSSQSLAIQRATGSRYSHMGIIVHRDGKPFVFEAVATVRLTPLDQWIARGDGGHYVVKRLRDAESVLTPAALGKLRSEAQRLAGRRYDLAFGWADDRIYCSELVWKAYDRALGIQIGGLQKVREFNLADPAVKAKLRERYGDDVPLDEPVISPAAMFDSPRLVTVGSVR